jgi:hypothetical protein
VALASSGKVRVGFWYSARRSFSGRDIPLGLM